MKNYPLQPRRYALPSLAAVLLTICYTPVFAESAGENLPKSVELVSACFPQFGASAYYDLGQQTDVALHRSGLVVEFHKEGLGAALWYRLGQIHGSGVTWGGNRVAGMNGHYPAVAISKEGYVIVVYSSRNSQTDCQLYYRVGKLDPAGDQTQSITWLTDIIHWDAGFRNSIAINDSGAIVSVHETHGSSNSLYYRVGRLKNPAGGEYTVQWDSAPWGINYDTGTSPHIAINNHNQVVEVHQVPGEWLLHYRRGNLVGGTIQWGDSRRYDSHATNPGVALLDSGLVLEIHASNGLFSRTGTLSLSNGQDIDWAAPHAIDSRPVVKEPALASNGSSAVQTHHALVGTAHREELYFSVSDICD
jgi:hypothetical protein